MKGQQPEWANRGKTTLILNTLATILSSSRSTVCRLHHSGIYMYSALHIYSGLRTPHSSCLLVVGSYSPQLCPASYPDSRVPGVVRGHSHDGGHPEQTDPRLPESDAATVELHSVGDGWLPHLTHNTGIYVGVGLGGGRGPGGMVPHVWVNLNFSTFIRQSDSTSDLMLTPPLTFASYPHVVGLETIHESTRAKAYPQATTI